MKTQKVAKAYAKAIFELCRENKISVTAELTKLTELINKSDDLENVLFLDLFTNAEKNAVLEGIYAKVQFKQETKNFFAFLLQEGRIGLLPLIYKSVTVLEDDSMGFLKGSIEGIEDSISAEMKNQIKAILAKRLGVSPELEYKKNTNITAGFRATVQDLQVDATIDSQLESLKQSFNKK
ncbi:MAG: F0F1 ATP synthase subunit delta [Bdellovibrio sp.]|nr:F0F1 ATP synthase subunit delta [Bdellovibrio sp.]